MIRLLALACVVVCPLVARGAPLPKDPAKGMPHLVWQIKPIDGLIDDYKHVQQRINDESVLPSWDQIQNLAQFVLPNVRKAIDFTKPLGGYLVVDPDIAKSRPVLLFPIKDAAQFGALVDNWLLHANLHEVPDSDGLLEGQIELFGTSPVYLRFKNDYAYVAFVESDPIRDVKKLVAPTDLFLKEESAWIALRLSLDGVPEGAKKQMREAIDKLSGNGPEGILDSLIMGMIGASNAKNFSQKLRSAVDEAKWAALRLGFEQKSDTLALEFNLVPRKGTTLGKDIGEFKPRPSRFSGLLDDETAAGALFGYGNFGGLKLDFKMVDQFTKEVLENIGLDGSEASRGLLAKALMNAIQVNDVDAAAAIKKATGRNTYTLVFAAKLNQPKLLAAAMFAYLQTLPKEKRDAFKMDAVKLDGGISVHQLKLSGLSNRYAKTLGETDLYFCQKDDVLFAAIGTGAIDRLKECMKLEAKEGPQFLVEVNHAKLTGLVRNLQGEWSYGRWAALFPIEKRSTILQGKIEGGDVLRVRYTTDFPSLIKMGVVLK